MINWRCDECKESFMKTQKAQCLLCPNEGGLLKKLNLKLKKKHLKRINNKLFFNANRCLSLQNFEL